MANNELDVILRKSLIEGLNSEYFEMVQNEKNKENKLKKLQEELEKLLADYENADNQGRDKYFP